MPTTVNIADKETLDGVSTKVSAIYNKLPSGNIADASTLSTVSSDVTWIKNNMPTGGGSKTYTYHSLSLNKNSATIPANSIIYYVYYSLSGSGDPSRGTASFSLGSVTSASNWQTSTISNTVYMSCPISSSITASASGPSSGSARATIKYYTIS